jgi:hypothetical protein
MREESIIAHLTRRAEDCRARSRAAPSEKFRAMWEELAEQCDLRVRLFKKNRLSPRRKAERPTHPVP